MRQNRNSLASLLREAFGSSRFEMLLSLSKSRSKMSSLSRELNRPVQEIHRNAVKLAEMGLIEKEPDSMLNVTEAGRILLSLLPPIEFVFRHQAYFMVHTLSYLPGRFVHTIGALGSCKMMHGAAAIFDKTAYMCKDARHLRAVAAQVTRDHMKNAGEFVRRDGARISYIFGENTVVPKGRAQLLSEIQWKDYLQKGKVERRMVKRVNLHLVVTEAGACVMFPYLNGEVDMNAMFYGDGDDFLKWCNDLFSEMWNGAGRFDDSKLVEIG